MNEIGSLQPKKRNSTPQVLSPVQGHTPPERSWAQVGPRRVSCALLYSISLCGLAELSEVRKRGEAYVALRRGRWQGFALLSSWRWKTATECMDEMEVNASVTHQCRRVFSLSCLVWYSGHVHLNRTLSKFKDLSSQHLRSDQPEGKNAVCRPLKLIYLLILHFRANVSVSLPREYTRETRKIRFPFYFHLSGM